MAFGFKVADAYPADKTTIHWRGRVIEDPAEFEIFLRGPVKDRVTDAEFEFEIAQDLQALATTDMATATLESLLNAGTMPVDWEIGEAMAECLLETEFGVRWPWNENRDRKTPRASLPGADLVGLIGDGIDTRLLFGEVKTSSDAKNPPGVLNGRSGLIHQIDELAGNAALHRSLLFWLAARCKSTPLWEAFQHACRHYFQSKGEDVALVGVLLRDTAPHADDLRSRGEKLAKAYGSGTPSIRLDAWYAPRPICDWVDLTMAGS